MKVNLTGMWVCGMVVKAPDGSVHVQSEVIPDDF